jgi:hypothetical protein
MRNISPRRIGSIIASRIPGTRQHRHRLLMIIRRNTREYLAEFGQLSSLEPTTKAELLPFVRLQFAKVERANIWLGYVKGATEVIYFSLYWLLLGIAFTIAVSFYSSKSLTVSGASLTPDKELGELLLAITLGLTAGSIALLRLVFRTTRGFIVSRTTLTIFTAIIILFLIGIPLATEVYTQNWGSSDLGSKYCNI